MTDLLGEGVRGNRRELGDQQPLAYPELKR
jgi:hypothetical protein